MCDNDLSVLIIEGSPTPEELSECWESIQEQYSQAVAGQELIAKISDVKEYTALKVRINIGYSLLKMISGGRVSDNIIYKLYDFDYPLPAFSQDNLLSIIGTFEGYLKREVFELSELETEIQGKEGSNKKITRDNFYSMLSAIAEYLHIVIKENDTTVAYYCAVVKRYNQKVEFELNKNKQWQN